MKKLVAGVGLESRSRMGGIMSLTGGWRKNPLTLWIIQDAHLEFSMKKLVAGVGFESRSRSCGIMSLHKLLEAKSTFLTF